ncbi:MAG TPA: AAA family ATPase [Dissulfurispiraceae bacterium]|nr:AAA family ATPase [Dissulfurispiraceae bacterium]
MSVHQQLIEPVSMIVLTGGPCSGKSSSLAYLTEKLSDHGFMVFVVPETATLITDSGIDRRKMHRQRQVALYEEAILDLQLAFEETYRNAAERVFPEKKKVILLDRGIMDIKAFVSDAEFSAMLQKRGLREIALRDRYTGIIHLVTAADGALKFYTGENNAARIETPEESIVLDRKIRESWLGHPRLRIIDNSTDFQGKIMRAFEAISGLIGLPAPLNCRERFVIKNLSLKQLPVHRTIQIEVTYLKSKDRKEEIRIKKRGQDGSYLYFLSRRSGGAGAEEEELLTEQHYLNLSKLIDPKTEVLKKERICFEWNNHYCEVDRYKDRHTGLNILKIEPFDGALSGRNIDVPPFVVIGKRVTDEVEYDERHMALKQKGLSSASRSK